MDLVTIANRLVAANKGILAADERPSSLEKRFESQNIEFTADNARAYRELLLTTPDVSSFIGGVILHKTTLEACSSDGTPFPQLLSRQGIVPGVKVDEGTKPLAGTKRETVTDGLDRLSVRLREYRELGACFTKWRATISIGDEIPSATS